MIARLKGWARALKNKVAALYLAARDPRTPRLAKAVSLLVVGYALSPIDLIPDFVPVLGYLDDLILVPLGIGLAIRLVPAGLMAEFRAAAAASVALPRSRWAAAIIISLWAVFVVSVLWWTHAYVTSPRVGDQP